MGEMYSERRMGPIKYGALWHARETNRWFGSNGANAAPFTPKLVESRERSVEWSMVSKAALRSKETSKVG